MLSTNMYKVLSCFPRQLGNYILYENLVEMCQLDENSIKECLNETLYPNWNYIRKSDGWKKGSQLYLTESGLAELEDHEHLRTIDKFTRRSIKIAIVAMIAAIASAIATIISIFT